MTGPIGYEDQYQIGARPYLERVGGDMVGPVTFQVSGAATPHLAAGTGFGPLVLGKAATATHATADTDVVIGDDFEVKGMTWALGNIRADTLQSVAANTPISVSNQQGSGFSANYNSTTMHARNTTDATTQVFRLTAGKSTTAGREAGPIGIYAGYNSTDVGRYAPVVIGAQPYVTTATYAALLTDQDDPLFAVFDREDPGSIADHFLYLQRKRTAFSPITYYSLLASELGPLVLGSPALEDALNVDPVYTRDVAMAGIFFGIAGLKAGEQGLVSDPGDDLRLRAGTGFVAGGGPSGDLEAGGARVRFGTFVADAGATIAGYIKAKEDDGTERFLAVVTAGE